MIGSYHQLTSSHPCAGENDPHSRAHIPSMTTIAHSVNCVARLDGALACGGGVDSSSPGDSFSDDAHRLRSITCSPDSNFPMSPIPEESGELSGYELGGGATPPWLQVVVESKAMPQTPPPHRPAVHMHRQVVPSDNPATPESLKIRSMELSPPGCQAMTPLSEQGSSDGAVFECLEIDQGSPDHPARPEEKDRERKHVWLGAIVEAGPPIFCCMIPFAACLTLWFW